MTLPPLILTPECDGLVAILVDRGGGKYAIEIGKPERYPASAERGFISRLTVEGNQYAGRLVSFSEKNAIDPVTQTG